MTDRGLRDANKLRETEADSVTGETQDLCKHRWGREDAVSALRSASCADFLWAPGALYEGRHLPSRLRFCSGFSFWFTL